MHPETDLFVDAQLKLNKVINGMSHGSLKLFFSENTKHSHCCLLGFVNPSQFSRGLYEISNLFAIKQSKKDDKVNLVGRDKKALLNCVEAAIYVASIIEEILASSELQINHHHHHHHQGMPTSWIPLSLSDHLSLLVISLRKSSWQHLPSVLS